MAVRRKPAPGAQTVDNASQSQPIDPSIVRYSLSDTPLTVHPTSEIEISSESYEHGDTNLNQLLQETHSDSHGLENHMHSTRAHSNDSNETPSTIHELGPQGNDLYTHITLSHVEYKPYQPGQHLAPILTGETLQLDEQELTPNQNPNPFSDSKISFQTASQNYYYDQDYRPPSAHSYMSEGEPLHAGSDGNRFHRASGAYASGNYSHTSLIPPRSRSPTPVVDDEDYYVVNNDSVHHTRYSHMTYQDPEKKVLHQGHLNPYFEHDYHAPAQTIVYDPDPETPTSFQSSLPETPLETRHFGPAPSGRILRRRKTKRRVQTTNGNFVIDLDIPTKLVLPRRGEPETMKTRYTAVTGDPDDFEKNGFFLRQNISGRRTELFIVITMYNEDEILFCRTMHGVMRNIAHLCTRKNSQTWGPNAWEKVVVCIVADGRHKIHPRVLDCLTLLGVYQPGPMTSSFDKKDVTAHLFEYTTTFGLDSNLHFKYPDKGIVPTQIMFLLKEKNQKKINSHRWFFNAFGPLLQPNVCVLLDVGTRPGNNSIYRLWKAFDVNSNVGGACGEIATYKGKNWSLLVNPLVAAQNFEYKISTILDKTTESMFGYISVLPGAFSAYRYIALQNDEKGQGPLASYFKGEVLHGRDTDIFTSNMYLAEDRILCFELVAKANSSWVLKYVKGAIGETDVPEALPEFISQRRRWLNGSFFAATYAIAHVGQIMRSGHSSIRKAMLMVETVYNIINLIFSWFSIGNFYLFFVVLTSSLEDPSFRLKGIKFFNMFIQYMMASMTVACFLISTGNRPQTTKWKYKSIAIVLSILMIYLIFASVMCAAQAASQGGSANSTMLFSVVVTYGLYLLSSMLAFDPWHMITSFLPYMLLSPTYINVLNIYAFSNLDDISWGTKQDSVVIPDLQAVVQDSQKGVDVELETPDDTTIYEDALMNLKTRKPVTQPSQAAEMSILEREQIAKDYYASVRTNVLLTWVLSNGLLLVCILGNAEPTNTFSREQSTSWTKSYLVFILAFTAITNGVRFIGSTLYLMARAIAG